MVDVGGDGVGGEGGAVPMFGETGAAVDPSQGNDVTTVHGRGPAGLPTGGVGQEPDGPTIDDADGPVLLVDEAVMGRRKVPLSTSVAPRSRPTVGSDGFRSR